MGTSRLEHDFEAFIGGDDAACRRAAVIFQQGDAEDESWILGAVADDELQEFALEVVRLAGIMSNAVFSAILAAAVEQIDLDDARDLVRLCVESRGEPPVVGTLLRALPKQSDLDKAGTVAALFWAHQSDRQDAAVELSRHSEKTVLLAEFMASGSAPVRRAIAALLPMDMESYPEALRGRAQAFVERARRDPDPYVRHRVELGEGKTELMYPLPPRLE